MRPSHGAQTLVAVLFFIFYFIFYFIFLFFFFFTLVAVSGAKRPGSHGVHASAPAELKNPGKQSPELRAGVGVLAFDDNG